MTSDHPSFRTAVVFGAGSDANPERRPGVPMESDPVPAGNAHWERPERQEPEVSVLKRATAEELTPVFSNAIPPRLVSGQLRRLAYKVPEHRLSHWMLLLFADRVDVMEHRVARALPFALPLAAVGVAVLLGVRARRKRRSLFRSWLS